MGRSKSSAKREVYSNTSLPQETGNISNKQPNLAPKAVRERRTKKTKKQKNKNKKRKQKKNSLRTFLVAQWLRIRLDDPKPMGRSKSSAKREVYSNTSLPKETGNISNKQPNLAPKAIRERRTKKPRKLAEGKTS